MDNIYNELNNYLKRSNRNNTNEVICRFMLNHLMEIPEMSVSEIADACYTSHPSIIRFTRELGFEGIADFKYNVQEYIDEVKRHELRVSFDVDVFLDDEGYKGSLVNWLGSQNDFFISSLEDLERQKVIDLCKDIHDHKNVYIIGAGLSLAIGELFRIELARCGKILNNISDFPDDMNSTDRKKTMIIVISMYGFWLAKTSRDKQISDIDSYLKRYSDRTWLVTLKGGEKSSHLDHTIAIGSRDRSFDMTLNLMIVFFEIVAECYQKLYK